MSNLVYRHRALGAPHDSDRQTGMWADLHAKAATHARLFHHRPVYVGEIKTDGLGPQGADGHAGTTHAPIHPRITSGPVDPGHPHVDVLSRGWRKGLGRTDLHAFATQRAACRLRIDIGRVDLVTAVALVEHDATGFTIKNGLASNLIFS